VIQEPTVPTFPFPLRSMPRCTPLLGVLTISAFTHPPTAELVVRDLQADLTVLPTAFSFQTSSPTVDASGDDRFRSGTGLALGARRSFATPGSAWGLTAGGDLFSQAWTYASDGSLATYGVHVSAGAGWAINDQWTLSLEPGVQVGSARLQLPATTVGPAFSATGRQTGFDLRLQAGWQMSERWILRAQVGWMSATFTGSENDGVTQDLTVRGAMVGIGVAWRWSNAPEPLR